MARKKYFYPPAPAVGSETFSDNIVGFQLVDGGGLTQGNFTFTSAIYEKVNRKFDTGLFSDPYTLENLKIDDIEETKRLIEKNFKVYPNFDISQITSFSLYGSLQKRLSGSVTKIINFFPAAIEVNNPANFGIISTPTATNISFDSINDETTFDLDVFTFNNPFAIDYSVNARRNLETRPFAVSKYRNLRDYYESYAVYFKDLTTEYQIVDFIPTQSLTGGTATITVKGDPFNNKTTPITQTFETLIIKPNNLTTEKIFSDDFDEIEDFLLNRKTVPLYTPNFLYPDYDSDGNYTMYNEKVTWKLGGYWNLDILSDNFDKYLSKLQKIAELLDSYKTNLISRFLITGAFKDFDTADQKVEKVLQIYGRSFDEVKKFIDALAHMNSVNYVVGDDIPSQLLVNLAQTLGIDPNISPVTNEDFLTSVFSPNTKQVYEGQTKPDTPSELNYQYYRNLILNAAYMFKSKGTRKSIEYLMRMIGAPDALVDFNEIVYLVDTKLNVSKFDSKFANISGGTFFNEKPILDPTNLYSIQGKTFSGYTTSGVIQLTPSSREDFPIDEDGYPKTASSNEDYFFQLGSGWFEQTPKHRSIELPDLENSSFNPQNPFLVSTIKPYRYGQDFLDRFRKFPNMENYGFEIKKIVDNQKSWDIQTEIRKNNVTSAGVDYKTKDDRYVINTKNIELYMNMGQGITYDIWDMSVKYDYPIPSSGITTPYPSTLDIGATYINPKPKEKTFFEFAQNFYNNFINVRNRWTSSDGKTGGYPTLQSIFWKYLQSKETVGIPSNEYTYQKMIDFTLGIGDYWQRLVEQVVPSSTLWLTGQKMENSIFHRQKFVYRRQRGCVFVPVACIPCQYNGQPFTYDCIDQTLTCNLSNLTNPNTISRILSSSLNNVIKNNGFTQNLCDLNSILSTWYIDLRLDNDILIQEPFYTGYGNSDVPTTIQVFNAIDEKLDNLYQFGLNSYIANTNLIVSNSTCYDDFTDKTLYFNIGLDIQINCDQQKPTPIL